jgi:hypothetical protein
MHIGMSELFTKHHDFHEHLTISNGFDWNIFHGTKRAWSPYLEFGEASGERKGEKDGFFAG